MILALRNMHMSGENRSVFVSTLLLLAGRLQLTLTRVGYSFRVLMPLCPYQMFCICRNWLCQLPTGYMRKTIASLSVKCGNFWNVLCFLVSHVQSASISSLLAFLKCFGCIVGELPCERQFSHKLFGKISPSRFAHIFDCLCGRVLSADIPRYRLAQSSCLFLNAYTWPSPISRMLCTGPVARQACSYFYRNWIVGKLAGMRCTASDANLSRSFYLDNTYPMTCQEGC